MYSFPQKDEDELRVFVREMEKEKPIYIGEALHLYISHHLRHLSSSIKLSFQTYPFREMKPLSLLCIFIILSFVVGFFRGYHYFSGVDYLTPCSRL
uniref:Uncharacterized protein n=1 Tax=Cucumis melo TaxID=3656 RepID=A0A9I9E7D9_CUCME